MEEVILTLPEDRMICDKCGGAFRLIGKKLLRREMVIIPRQQKIIAYHGCSYECDQCEKETGYARILTTPQRKASGELSGRLYRVPGD